MKQLTFTDGTYRTAPQPISWFARTFPTTAFYLKFLGIIARSVYSALRSRYDDQRWSDSSLEVLRALEQVGVRFEITGIEHIRDTAGPCLLVGNHLSTLETTVLPCIIQPLRKVTFVIKAALLEYPIFRHVMRTRDPIAVSQTDPRRDFKQMLEGGEERLRRGTSIIIFPEGERVRAFNPTRFNSIGVKLAVRAGVPIIPFALKTDAWAIGNWVSEFGRIDPSKTVHFAFGPPIRPEGRGMEQHRAIIEFIEEKLRAWGMGNLSPSTAEALPA